jgi:hypothetical protein
MGRILIISFFLAIVVGAACIGLWFGSWMFKLSAMKTAPYILGCFVGAPLVAIAIAVSIVIVPLAGFLSGIIGRGK